MKTLILFLLFTGTAFAQHRDSTHVWHGINFDSLHKARGTEWHTKHFGPDTTPNHPPGLPYYHQNHIQDSLRKLHGH